MTLGHVCTHIKPRLKSRRLKWQSMLRLKNTKNGVLKNASFIGDIVSLRGCISGNELCQKLQIRRAMKSGLAVEAIDNNYILGAFVGLVVFAIGVFWLELDSAAPTQLISQRKSKMVQ